MSVKEQACFYRELCRRGISMSGDGGNGIIIGKMPTSLDDRALLPQSMPDEEQAIKFLKNLIEWQYEEEKIIESQNEVAEEDAVEIRYRIELMLDLGIGPQMADLGIGITSDNHTDWYDKAHKYAVEKSIAYLKKEYPDRDVNTIEWDVKIRPVEEGV